MRVKVYQIAVAVLVAIIVVSFFLPWVSVESQAAGILGKIFSDKKTVSVEHFSGFRIPLVANSEDAKLITAVVHLFYPKMQDVGEKSKLVWVMPIGALILLCLVYLLGDKKTVNLALVCIGLAVFFAGIFKIFTTDLDKVVFKVVIGIGMWLTLCGYGAIGLASLAQYIGAGFAKNKKL